jgi:hypothetical protein
VESATPGGVATGTSWASAVILPSALLKLELLRGSDVARELGISRQAVHQAYRRGRAPAPTVVLPFGPLWSRADVDRWAARRLDRAA